MRLEISAFSELMPLLLPTRAGGYVIVVLYVIAIALFLRSHLPEWRSIATGSKLVGWLVLLAFGALLSGVALVYTSEPGIIRSTLQSHILRVPGTPLLGAVAIMIVGSWLGMWPAVFVGLASGLVQSLFVTGRGIQIAEVTLVAALATYFLRQRFGGITYTILRHPLVAGLFAGVSSILLTYPAVLASIDRLGSMSLLATSANAWTLTQAIILPTLLQWFLAGTTLWLAAFAIDALRPPSTPRAVPAYARSLTQRFLFYLVPALLVVMALLLFVVTRIAIRSATDLVLQQMAHDARVASEMVPDVTVISSNVLDRFADERRAASLGLETTTNLSSDLESQLRSSNHFRQLVLVNKEGTVLQASPSIDEEQFPLSEVEALAAQAAARLGQPRTVRAWLADQRIPVHTHIEPLLDEQGQPIGALMGRVDLSVLLQPSVSSLQGTVGAGDGFIVDEEWTIIAHRRQD
ncbi:MAG: cache domain-containing protein, partial [Chloroflexota bacterium]